MSTPERRARQKAGLAWIRGEGDARNTREILVHLSVTIPGGDTRTADEVADRVVEFASSLTVDDSILSIVCPLAEEVTS